MTIKVDLENALSILINDGTIGSTELTQAEKAEALITALETLKTEADVAASEAAVVAETNSRRDIFIAKKEEFFMRAQTRFMELIDADGNYTIANFITFMTTAFTEIKAEMIAEGV